ncbi:hypothetical protein [Nitrosomonas communis]|jgi:hypothetical protein|uniref:Beta-lactamase-inhibitor-like PepSY-like domain-containing protein n=1 Tax=Nitrosomonas communis TaxID=44574 RepID=A0A1I4SKH8_9PROT|nr:hypothetical protein [Nitrosomonas communis]SFM64891.1 hypothetical protein SAMN05421863_104125 [Nitrosomonas communis]
MNIKARTLITAIALTAFVTPIFAQKYEAEVKLYQLPEPVQQTIIANLQGGEAEKIEQEIMNSVTTYDVHVKTRDWRTFNMQVDENGRLVLDEKARSLSY